MGIWIRSQDGRRLVNATDVYAITAIIYDDTNGEKRCTLGEYTHREEAIKVIDLIQEHLNSIIPEKVFQMPAKGFTQKEKATAQS